ncbi:MAG: GntR family transcriptional regulator [Dysgonamonadaceae bacterium]|jgi:DNA-binding transcriptional regulator YhcF (GntR family)|nr:GntR family transcriptional regulator [Dysgonamonadaceae bacterium]
MDFKASKGIFLQIADNICRQILEGRLPAGERTPSVRDLAADLEVNRNTVLRTYESLEREGIIENRRGVGYFVSESAASIIADREKEEFFRSDLPEFIGKVKLLNLENEVKQLLEKEL